MDDYSIALGNAVKEARTESKLTQEQIADMLDIDSRTISQIERGLGNPKLERVYPEFCVNVLRKCKQQKLV